MGNSEITRPSPKPLNRQVYATADQALSMRLDLELSQKNFAALLGTTNSCVQSWEKGSRKMPRGLSALARVAASERAYREMVASLPVPNAKMIAMLLKHGRTPRPRGRRS